MGARDERSTDDHVGGGEVGQVAVLGAGMHPWGKWGRPFVEYGLAAARETVAAPGWAGATCNWSRRDTIRNGYPGFVAGATFAQALGWTGVPVASVYAACASGAVAIANARAQILAGLCDVALVVGADTTPKGFFTPVGGDRKDDPDWLRFHLLGDEPHLLRALPAPAHGSLRRDGGGLRPGQGEERVRRFGEPERALPRRGHGRGGAGVADGGGPAPPARDLRHVGRRRRVGALEHGVRTASHRRRVTVGHRRRRRDHHTFVPEHGDRDAELLDGLGRGDGDPVYSPAGGRGVPALHRVAAYAEAGIGPEDVSLAEVYDLSSALELDWYEDIGLCGEGEAEKLLHDGVTSLGGRVPVNPSGGLLCFGEAIPAEAIAQVCEGVWQLRGDATGRQVEGARVAVTVNQGLFGHGSSVVLSR